MDASSPSPLPSPEGWRKTAVTAFSALVIMFSPANALAAETPAVEKDLSPAEMLVQRTTDAQVCGVCVSMPTALFMYGLKAHSREEVLRFCFVLYRADECVHADHSSNTVYCSEGDYSTLVLCIILIVVIFRLQRPGGCVESRRVFVLLSFGFAVLTQTYTDAGNMDLLLPLETGSWFYAP